MKKEEKRGRFEKLISLQEEAGCILLTSFGTFEEWADETTDEEWDALMERETAYADGLLRYLKYDPFTAE